MSDESGEVKVANANSLKHANKLRSEIWNKFPKIWVIVFKHEESRIGVVKTIKKYEVCVANEWCGRLPKEKIREIEQFCKSTISKRSGKKKEPSVTEAVLTSSLAK